MNACFSEISKLNLRRIDFSANKISSIPLVFRSMQTLEEMILDHNPLVTPPAHVSIISFVKYIFKNYFLNCFDSSERNHKSI